MTFEEFIRDWKSARIGTLESMEAEDQDYLVRRRANELRELASRRGFHLDLVGAAQPFKGVSGLVRHMYLETELERAFASADPNEIVLHLPACVRLHGEMMAIIPGDEGINKYSIRVEREDGALRRLTPDEEIALAIVPAARAERERAAKQVIVPESGLRLVLLPEPWREGDLTIVMWQLRQAEDAQCGGGRTADSNLTLNSKLAESG
jgi:hypothetical protein